MKTQIQKPHRKNLLLARAHKAFSLVELLVVIAVIGIIAAIAIPNIAGITTSAGTARDQRNAQSLSSVFSAARAAGNNAAYADVDAAVTAITGATPLAVGGATFQVPNIPTTELASAKTHLTLTATTAVGQLIYAP